MDKGSLLNELESLKDLQRIQTEQINRYEEELRKESARLMNRYKDGKWKRFPKYANLCNEQQTIKRALADTKTKIEATIAQVSLVTKQGGDTQ